MPRCASGPRRPQFTFLLSLNRRRLIIRPGAIGDCILCLPAMEYLADADYTEIWVPSPVVPLIQFGQKVRTISSTGLDMLGVGDLPLDPMLMSYLDSFDHIVSWYGANRPEFRAVVRAEFHTALPPPDYRGHVADFFAGQVGAPLGGQPRIRVQASEQRESIVVHPFSGSRRKNWPLESFRKLAARFRLAVEWCAGPEEALADAHRFEDLAELASWLSGARLYLGNDSGITHLAAATGMPVVAIFVATDPHVWAPRGPNVTVIRVNRPPG